MKNKILYIGVLAILFSCKNETKETTTVDANKTEQKQYNPNDGLTLLKGEFLYLADAAVLKTHREIYGVVIDQKMHQLDDMVKPYKKEDTDMIPVTIRGLITKKPEGEEGWDYRVAIKEILEVTAPKPNDSSVIKIGNQNYVKDK